MSDANTQSSPASAAVMSSRLYRSQAGKDAVLELYERKFERLPFPCERKLVETRFGPTNVLVTGAPRGKPVVALHGVHFGGPFMAQFIGPLGSKFKFFIPDTIG